MQNTVKIQKKDNQLQLLTLNYTCCCPVTVQVGSQFYIPAVYCNTFSVEVDGTVETRSFKPLQIL